MHADEKFDAVLSSIEHDVVEEVQDGVIICADGGLQVRIRSDRSVLRRVIREVEHGWSISKASSYLGGCSGLAINPNPGVIGRSITCQDGTSRIFDDASPENLHVCMLQGSEV